MNEAIDSRILTTGDIVSILFDKKKSTREALVSLGVSVVWDSYEKMPQLNVLLSNDIDSNTEKQQMIVFWKPAGVSSIEIQSAAWSFSSLSTSEETQNIKSSLEMLDFINCSLTKRYLKNANGFIVANQIEKAAYGLVVALSGTKMVEWFENAVSNKKVEFEFTGLSHGKVDTIFLQDITQKKSLLHLTDNLSDDIDKEAIR
ncbi:hypothetical protein BB561_002804 [Smittium simulii]|uniref:Uncharacterized protein n=1 Tax=Smittium simulii TaxID=133385 RepID=A0A2T9YP48_9FUNG|nr:hypothetical protein BB561_002804 [Smittium simulii]